MLYNCLPDALTIPRVNRLEFWLTALRLGPELLPRTNFLDGISWTRFIFDIKNKDTKSKNSRAHHPLSYSCRSFSKSNHALYSRTSGKKPLRVATLIIPVNPRAVRPGKSHMCGLSLSVSYAWLDGIFRPFLRYMKINELCSKLWLYRVTMYNVENWEIEPHCRTICGRIKYFEEFIIRAKSNRKSFRVTLIFPVIQEERSLLEYSGTCARKNRLISTVLRRSWMWVWVCDAERLYQVASKWLTEHHQNILFSIFFHFPICHARRTGRRRATRKYACMIPTSSLLLRANQTAWGFISAYAVASGWGLEVHAREGLTGQNMKKLKKKILHEWTEKDMISKCAAWRRADKFENSLFFRVLSELSVLRFLGSG